MENGKGRGRPGNILSQTEKVLSCRQIDHVVVVIPLPSVCKGAALVELGRGSLSSPVQSEWFLPLRPAYVLSLHHSYVLTEIRYLSKTWQTPLQTSLQGLSNCLSALHKHAHQQKLNICKSRFKIAEQSTKLNQASNKIRRYTSSPGTDFKLLVLLFLLL